MAATKPAFTPPGKKGDMIFSALVKLAALIVLLMLGGIIVSLIISSWPSIQKFGFAFLWTKEWDAPNEIFGALVPIYGTLVTSFIALLIAVPVSFGIALFLTELSPAWLKRPLGIAIELLAAIPSIVYGMWGLFIFAPLFATYFQEPVGNVLSTIPFVGALFAGPAFGIGILAAGVILAIMIIPYIAAVMRDVFEQTPVMMKESAYGIGCTTWEVIWRIVLPFTKNGVIGGVMLGLGRALGETMAVTFIIGNTYQLDSISLYMPGNSITSALANEFAEAETGLHVAALMELGLPGSAYVYQGEELGLFEVANIPWDRLEDPTPFNTRRNFTDKGRDGCRVPMPWKAADCGEPASWSPDFITGGTFGFGPEQGDSADAHLPQPAWFKDFAADVEADDNGSMLHLYRKLLQLRQTVLTATGDTSADLLDMGDTVVAYSRPATEGRRFLSVTNFGDEPIALPDDAVAIANSVPLTDDGKLDSDASVWLLLG